MLHLTTTTLKKRKGQEILTDRVSTDQEKGTIKTRDGHREFLTLGEGKEPVAKEILEAKQKGTNLKEVLTTKEGFKKESADYNLNRLEDAPLRFIQNKKSFLSESVVIPNITRSDTDVRGNKMVQANIKDSNQKINSHTPLKDSINSLKRKRYIPVSVRKKVFQRAKGCCEFVGSEGKRCSSRHQLEFDHVISWSHGGENNEDSLQVLCRQHNQFRVKETHGFWYQKR